MAQNLFPSTKLYIVRMLLGEKIFCEAGQAWYMVIMLGYSANCSVVSLFSTVYCYLSSLFILLFSLFMLAIKSVLHIVGPFEY